MALKAILFDVDGTLVDSNDLHVLAWSEVFRDAGFDIARALIHAQVGKGGDNLVPSLLPDLPPADRKRLADAHGPIYMGRYIERVRQFPEARDLLARAKADGLAVALASSADAEELDRYISLLDAADLIDATTGKGDVEVSKPAPDIFRAALRKVGVEAREALVVGDSPWDVLAAGRANIRTVALLSGGFAAAELDGAVAVYRDAADLLAQWNASPVKEQVQAS